MESSTGSNPATPPITKILSQYELLQSVCKGLSSADIIHLAASCKEHWAYIASSKATLAKLNSTAQCDGRGIVAQARVFGYWNGNPSNAHRKCLSTDTKPCSSCDAQHCRFHFVYAPGSPLICPWQENCIAEFVEEEGIEIPLTAKKRVPTLSIESGKAFDMFWNYRQRVFCEACEPLRIGFDNDFQTCHCKFYDHFVGNRWLCLPCFFVEEAKAYKEGRNGRDEVHKCDCGAPALEESALACGVCKGVEGWYNGRTTAMLSKILAQLG